MSNFWRIRKTFPNAHELYTFTINLQVVSDSFTITFRLTKITYDVFAVNLRIDTNDYDMFQKHYESFTSV